MAGSTPYAEVSAHIHSLNTHLSLLMRKTSARAICAATERSLGMGSIASKVGIMSKMCARACGRGKEAASSGLDQ